MAAIASKLGLNKTELSVAWASGMAYDLTARHGSCRLQSRPTPGNRAVWPAPTTERQKERANDSSDNSPEEATVFVAIILCNNNLKAFMTMSPNKGALTQMELYSDGGI